MPRRACVESHHARRAVRIQAHRQSPVKAGRCECRAGRSRRHAPDLLAISKSRRGSGRLYGDCCDEPVFRCRRRTLLAPAEAPATAIVALAAVVASTGTFMGRRGGRAIGSMPRQGRPTGLPKPLEGQARRFDLLTVTSGVPPTSDIAGPRRHLPDVVAYPFTHQPDGWSVFRISAAVNLPASMAAVHKEWSGRTS